MLTWGKKMQWMEVNNLTFLFSTLDPLTEIYGLGFYLQYMARWPELFMVNNIFSNGK